MISDPRFVEAQSRFASALWRARESRNLPREELANRINASTQSVYRWEHARTMPTWAQLPPLHDELELPAFALLGNFVDAATLGLDTRSTILADPDLDADDKEVLLANYLNLTRKAARVVEVERALADRPTVRLFRSPGGESSAD